jgi:hypothetical protein
VAVDNLEAAVKRFDEEGVKFKKRPEEGKMRVSLDISSLGEGTDDSTLPSFTILMDTGSRSLLTVESPLSR